MVVRIPSNPDVPEALVQGKEMLCYDNSDTISNRGT